MGAAGSQRGSGAYSECEHLPLGLEDHAVEVEEGKAGEDWSMEGSVENEGGGPGFIQREGSEAEAGRQFSPSLLHLLMFLPSYIIF